MSLLLEEGDDRVPEPEIVRSPEQLIAEREECIALGIHEIDWFDPLMLHNRRRVMDMALEVKRKNLDIIWSCRSRIDSHQPRDNR